MSEINTHHFKMPNGKHKGELITRVPVNYLMWMANTKDHSLKDYAEAELERRGTVIPKIELSGHAINRASLRILNQWQDDRNNGEGLHAWLCRRGYEAYQKKAKNKDRSHHIGVIWIFEDGEVYPTIKTVMVKKGKNNDQK